MLWNEVRSTAVGGDNQEGPAERGRHVDDLPESHAEAEYDLGDRVTPDLHLEIEAASRVNFAMQQNNVALVQRLRLFNRGSVDLVDVEVRLRGEPEFLVDWSRRVDRLGAGRELNLEAIDLALSPAFLVNLDEALRARLWLEVRSAGQLVASSSHAVEVLAYDQWPGASSLPEIISAFVMPNHPEVARILAVAADLLEQSTGSSALDGYQREDPQRVWAMASAIYRAVQILGIEYVNPPASFEEEGQKVRTPDRVVGEKRGTCLDLTLLLAACLEQAGLHPWIVLVRGHAFPGLWLREECWPSPVVDDASALRKRRDLGEMRFFDSSSVAQRPVVDFDAAVRTASACLESDANLYFAVDVHQSRRLGRIRPMAGRVAEAGFQPLVQPDADPAAEGGWTPGMLPSDLSRPGSVVASEKRVLDGPAARLDRWKRKLLDLSLRNRLLNFKEAKRTIPLLIPNLAEFEDAIASGRGFNVDAAPANADVPAATMMGALRAGDPQLRKVLDELLADGRLHAALAERELERRLTAIYREAKSSIEETGANTLYVALGMLRWFPNQAVSEPRNAPILLVPLEIRRSSARERFRISIGADEPRVNHTLFEMLRHDFGIDLGGIEELPSDDSGVDVPLVLRTVREKIRDVARWDVYDEAWIGLFSFSKFLMWRDLAERADTLLSNPVISHLVEASGCAFDGGGSFVERSAVDQRAPTATFCPLDADASQLAAVYSAEAGRSFALFGPPGTGKSQTITNLISQCLATGKTVLFVAEKMAALNVVRSRLEKVGLGPFCLELHSNKASKGDVIAQLAQVLECAGAKEPGDWAGEAARLERLRAELNQYARAIGERRPPHWSAFQVTSELIGLQAAKSVRLSWPSVDEVTREHLQNLREYVRRLATNGMAIGGPADHPWRGVARAEWSSFWQDEVEASSAALAEACVALRAAIDAVEPRLGLSGRRWGFADIEYLEEICGRIIDNPAPSGALLEENRWQDAETMLTKAIDQGRRRDALRLALSGKFTDELFALDLQDLSALLRRAQQSNALLRWFRRRPVLRSLRAVAVDGGAVGAEDAAQALADALEVEALHATLEEGGGEAERLLGRDWNSAIADWDRVERLVEWTRDVRRVAARLTDIDDDGNSRSKLLGSWRDLVCRDGDLLQAGAPLARDLERCRQAIRDLRRSWEAFRDLLTLSVAEFVEGGDHAELAHVAARVDACRAAVPRLREWCAWQDARRESEAGGLLPLIESYERADVSAVDLETCFEKSVRLWWLTRVTESEPSLRSFFSPDHERKIDEFRKLDQKMLDLAKQGARARLSASVPRGGADPAAGSEMGILVREIRKKARHMPVRRLIEKIPTLLPRLKPCFLMSPLSVAQYLDADLASFDVVIFDEASQIPVWDAIGALARGKQCVIVGDPKQLPPTAFFARGDDEEEVEEVTVEDQESILDEFLAARMPQLELDWHYRSRHESLIAFSNRHYYENRLLTFPSPLTDGIGVVHRPVPEGHYDKGKSRTNRAEAEALVAEIVERLRDSERSRYTLGVVTFSQAQQTLVEDLLDAARRDNPEIEAFFGDGVEEPVFVKNLENVQGDERDVILFSIGYGPDQLGRVSMNFGPLNRSGGERRLNVAVTRARVELVVFSTLRSDQIDLGRTRARGVEHLKFFLDYAERGPVALMAAEATSADADFESPFEREVCGRLQERGHRVELQVGCAGYRIDLAIVDPESPGRYLLGIECDGATYHRSQVARERDRLRESVLCGLGWNLHRIWSTDWWQNPERELGKIESALEKARRTPPERPRPSLPRVAAPAQPSAAAAPGHASGSAERTSGNNNLGLPFAAAGAGLLTRSAGSPRVDAVVEPQVPPYRAARLPLMAMEAAQLLQPAGARAVRELVRMLVAEEAPVTVDLALRRVGESFGLGRVGSRARVRILDILGSSDLHVRENGGIATIWKDAAQVETWRGYRPNTGSDQRAIGEIPAEELVGAIVDALETNVSLSREDLQREAARLLGFQRMGRIVQERLTLAVDLAIGAGMAEEADGWIRLPRGGVG